MATNGNAPEPPVVTSAAEFRHVREQGEVFKLPTGRVVRMSAVKPANLLRLGKIPDPLSELVMAVIYGKNTQESFEAIFGITERKEQTLDMVESMRVVCTAALVHPRIVDDPHADDEIHIDDLEYGEQLEIFAHAFWEATALSRFCREQAADVEPVAQVEVAELPTEPPGGDTE